MLRLIAPPPGRFSFLSDLSVTKKKSGPESVEFDAVQEAPVRTTLNHQRGDVTVGATLHVLLSRRAPLHPSHQATRPSQHR